MHLLTEEQDHPEEKTDFMDIRTKEIPYKTKNTRQASSAGVADWYGHQKRQCSANPCTTEP